VERRDDDGGTESFLPTYVYGAMGVKKQFEHMRVSFPLISSSFCSPFPLPFLSCWRRCRPLVLISLLKFPCYPRPDFE